MTETRIDHSGLKDAVNTVAAAADAYAEASRAVAGLNGGSDPVAPEWAKMRDDVHRVLAGSAENLLGVGEALIKTGQEVGAADGDQADKLGSVLEDVQDGVKPGAGWQR